MKEEGEGGGNRYELYHRIKTKDEKVELKVNPLIRKRRSALYTISHIRNRNMEVDHNSLGRDEILREAKMRRDRIRNEEIKEV